MNRMLSAALVVATVAGVSVPAHATYVCGYAKQTVGRTDNNPVVTSAIGLNDDYTKWSVHHQLADGKIVDRSTQYDLTNRSDDTTIKWSGRHLRHPNLWMEGVWRQVSATHAVYTETLHDDDKSKIVAQDVAECDKYVEPYAPEARRAPPPSQQYTPAPSPGGSDGVPFTMMRDGIHVVAAVGGVSTDMLVDTGASVSSISSALANSLLASGKATELRQTEVTLADGSKHMERVISVNSLTLGSHVRTNVLMTISEGGSLLGLPVLNAIGKFTIDSSANQLIFG